MSDNQASGSESASIDSLPSLNVRVDTTSDNNVSKDQNVEFADACNHTGFNPCTTQTVNKKAIMIWQILFWKISTEELLIGK